MTAWLVAVVLAFGLGYLWRSRLAVTRRRDPRRMLVALEELLVDPGRARTASPPPSAFGRARRGVVRGPPGYPRRLV